MLQSGMHQALAPEIHVGHRPSCVSLRQAPQSPFLDFLQIAAEPLRKGWMGKDASKVLFRTDEPHEILGAERMGYRISLHFALCAGLEMDGVPLMTVLEALQFLGLDLNEALVRAEGEHTQHAPLLCFAVQDGSVQLVKDLLALDCNPYGASQLIDEGTGLAVRDCLNAFGLADLAIAKAVEYSEEHARAEAVRAVLLFWKAEQTNDLPPEAP